jgi:TGF-beta receptor type-1
MAPNKLKSRKKNNSSYSLKCKCTENYCKVENNTCTTETVCLTRRLRNLNGSTWFKYFCDQSSQNSVRNKIINFKDCLTAVSTSRSSSSSGRNTNKQEIYNANSLYENCCNETNYCNKDLEPVGSILDIEEYMEKYESKNTNDLTSSTSNNHTTTILFTSLNLALLCILLVFVCITIFLIILYFIKNNMICCKNKNEKKKYYSKQNREEEEDDKMIVVDPSLTCSATSKLTTAIHLNSKDNTFNGYDWSGSEAESNKKLTTITTTTTTTNTNTTTSTSGAVTESRSQMTTSGDWSGSGSGAGVPQLLQRTIARQIKLIYPCIGKGRFGEVYKGMWRDEYVAVKTFNSADEKSWQNECNIYNTNGFRHENILGFIASDNIDRGTYTELWIITEFHSNGSLFDYLNQNTLTIYECLKMAISIVNGLDHLHTPIESCTGKPALAHCDLKSKNILVKSDLTCCIGDLGLALCGDKNGNIEQHYYRQNDEMIIRTGTKRYMAPEILNKTINIKSLNQFQNAEMYSLALIFWELLTRTKFELLNKIYIYEYKLPYYQYLPMDPNDLQMKQIVCEQKLRPEINYLWKQINIMNELTQLTEELWVENSNGRLNALRLKKSLNSIMRKNY